MDEAVRSRPGRRSTLGLICGLVVLPVLVQCGGEEPAGPPNVLIISIDTLRHDHLGAYGHGRGISPTMDRLAAQGVCFQNAASTTTWTLPSHCSLMTGQYPSSHGVIGGRFKLEPQKSTLAEILSAAGYQTAGFHSVSFLSAAYGLSQGFDVYERHGRDFDHRKSVVIGKGETMAARTRRAVSGPGVVARVREWLANEWTGQPFCVFAHIFDPHWLYLPHGAHARYLTSPPERAAPLPALPESRTLPQDASEATRLRALTFYDAEIRFVDRCLLELLRNLEEMGIERQTLVILVADHGEQFLEHGGVDHGDDLYEETLRIPMILRLPGVFDGGGIVTEPVSLVDVLPTVGRLLSLDIGDGIQGLPLQDIRDGDAHRAGVVAELGRRLRTFRGLRWKLIFDRKSGDTELYSLSDDPGERENLSDEKPTICAELMQAFRDSRYDRLAPDSVATPTLDPGAVKELQALGYVD